jgi:hypothetical protein
VQGLSGVTQIAAGDVNSYAISGGIPYGWGSNAGGQLAADDTLLERTRPWQMYRRLPSITQIDVSGSHVLAVSSPADFTIHLSVQTVEPGEAQVGVRAALYYGASPTIHLSASGCTSTSITPAALSPGGESLVFVSGLPCTLTVTGTTGTYTQTQSINLKFKSIPPPPEE